MQWDYGYSEEEHLGKPYNLKLLARLYPYARPYRAAFLFTVVLIILITLVELSIPYITRIAIDHYIVPQTDQASDSYYRVNMADQKILEITRRYPELFVEREDSMAIRSSDLKQLTREEIGILRKTDIQGLGRIAGLFIGLIVLNFILAFFRVYFMEYAGQKVMHRLRMELFTHIQELHISFFNRNPVGRLVTRVTNDTQNINELFSSVIIFLFEDLFLLIGIAIVLLAMDWKLALVTFALVPLVALASHRFANKARDMFRLLRVKIAEINTRFSETIQGMKVIQMFSREKDNFKSFSHLNHEYYLADMKQVHIFAVFMPLIEVFASISAAMVIYFGGRSVLSETITLGTLVAFISYLKMFYRPIRDLAEKYNIMQNAMASLERIFLIMDTDDRLPLPPEGQVTPVPRKITRVGVDGIGFAYIPGEPILRNVSFDIRSGETVAVVGPTGSGKTSLINLLIRFYDPESGRIRIDGRSINTMPLAELRQKMALVTQDPFLFSGTIRENIAGDRHLSEARLSEIFQAANVDDLISRLPDGPDTRITEGGAPLSSGERQLVSIARAIAREPELILLDEATSYIDSETEAKIQVALANLMRNRTSIVVAHRLSSIRNADRIIVLHKGRIIESGTHEALMRQKGFYFRLNRFQNN